MLLYPLPDSLYCLNGILLREEAVVWKEGGRLRKGRETSVNLLVKEVKHKSSLIRELRQNQFDGRDKL